MKYDIETSVAAEEHLDELSAFDRKRILERSKSNWVTNL
jgi:hypothetical protein